MEAANFLRIIGDSLGPAGFMAESSQVAMFIGPLFMILLIANYYKHFKSSLLQRSILLIGLFLTLSGSATIQILFILLTYLFIDLIKIKAHKDILLAVCVKLVLYSIIILITGLIIYHNYGSYIDAIYFKITSLLKLDTPRTEGARMLLERFSKNMLWGEGFGKFIETGIESNIFLPTLLFEHGLLGGVMFLILFFFPILFRFAKSPFKLYFIPFIAMFVNIFFAIGTYRWPLIWIIYTFTLFSLSPQIPLGTQYLEDNSRRGPGTCRFRHLMHLKNT
ncbi:MAG: hypothetical protein NTY36_13595 [Deltaproteobacteria bacterium]|nr:hypothetical protein [Deltaproteobacteria bacterium]